MVNTTTPEERALLRAEAEQKRGRALEMRKGGAKYEIIAKQLGYSNRGAAHKAVAAALKAEAQDTADDSRLLTAQRLDNILLALWPHVVKGKGYAIEHALRITEIQKAMGMHDDAQVASTSVVEAVTRDLAELPDNLRNGALAAAALQLARTIDQGLNQASCTKELRAVMAELAAKAPQKIEGDAVDDLGSRRAARRRAAAAAQ